MSNLFLPEYKTLAVARGRRPAVQSAEGVRRGDDGRRGGGEAVFLTFINSHSKLIHTSLKSFLNA